MFSQQGGFKTAKSQNPFSSASWGTNNSSHSLFPASSSPYDRPRSSYNDNQQSSIFSNTTQSYRPGTGRGYSRENSFGASRSYTDKTSNSIFATNRSGDNNRSIFSQGSEYQNKSSLFDSQRGGKGRGEWSSWGGRTDNNNNRSIFNSKHQQDSFQKNTSWNRNNYSSGYKNNEQSRYAWNRDQQSYENQSTLFNRRSQTPDMFSKKNTGGWGDSGYSSHFRQDRSRSPNMMGKSLGYSSTTGSNFFSQPSNSMGAQKDMLDPWKLTSREYPLPSMPSDLRKVMDMKWSPSNDLLLIPFQDGYLKGWHFDRRFGSSQLETECVMNIKMKFPVVSMDFVDEGCCFVYGDFNGNVLLFDLQSEEVSYFGNHEYGVSRVHYYPTHSLTLTLGDDSSMKFYDSRQEKPAHDFNMGLGIPVSSELRKDVFIFATNTNQISILNLDSVIKSGGKDYATFESPLYHKVEHVALNSDNTQIAMSGAEGRIAMRELNMRRSFDPEEMRKPAYNLQQNFTFKCHRDASKNDRKDFIRAINQITFHPRRNDVLATCGSDGSYFLWNIRYQSLILKGRPLPNPKTPISNIAFNRDGSLFSYIVGDDGTMGMHPEWKWGFGYFVRILLDTDLQLRQY